MKPTLQTSRQARHIESQRPQGAAVSKTPATDWAFQSAAELRGATASSSPGTERMQSPLGLYAMTHGQFEAETKVEERIEGVGLLIVIALAAWPMLVAMHTAVITSI